MVRARLVNGRGGDVVRPPPDENLLLPVLVHGLLLVQSLQSAFGFDNAGGLGFGFARNEKTPPQYVGGGMHPVKGTDRNVSR